MVESIQKEYQNILNKVHEIEVFDFSESYNVIWLLNKFVNKHHLHLNQYILSDITRIKLDLELGAKNKNMSNWQSGYKALLDVVNSIDSLESSFPD